MHSEIVLKALKQAGWYEGRSVDIEPYIKVLLKWGHHYIPDVIQDMLREYAGLIIEIPRPDRIYNEIDLTQILRILPNKPYYSGDKIFEPLVNNDLIFIGEIWSGYFLLYMTPDGKVYADNGGILYLGDSFDEMLENVFTPNFKAKEIS